MNETFFNELTNSQNYGQINFRTWPHAFFFVNVDAAARFNLIKVYPTKYGKSVENSYANVELHVFCPIKMHSCSLHVPDTRCAIFFCMILLNKESVQAVFLPNHEEFLGFFVTCLANADGTECTNQIKCGNFSVLNVLSLFWWYATEMWN